MIETVPMLAPRRGDWIMTASGRPFWPLDPSVDDVAIEDIAHHLSNLCRFTGAVRSFYSVAQHSVLVARRLTESVAMNGGDWHTRAVAGLYGLLHDASEAYLIDIPRPLKHAPDFAPYRRVETLVQGVVYEAFGLAAADEPAMLKAIDRQMLRTEQRDLMPPPAFDERRDDVEPYGWRIVPQIPEIARSGFLSTFRALIDVRDGEARAAR